jgi:urease accessory protein
MQRAIAVVRRAAVAPERVVDSITLDHEGRHRRRLHLTGSGGTGFVLDLERAMALEDGDALELEDGGLILVRAAPQAVLEVRAASPLALLRIAWHIGNRHTPAEISETAITIEDDPVLAEMVRGLGGSVTPVNRPFRPERGAYDRAGTHSHSHGHGHGHGHHHHPHDHHQDHDHD